MFEWLVSIVRFLELLDKLLGMSLFEKLSAKLIHKRSPQFVRWVAIGPGGPCLSLLDADQQQVGMIPWETLKPELEMRLLVHAFADPRPYTLGTFEHYGKPNWVIKVLDSEGRGYCYLWLGVDPDNGWAFDGLIRFGGNESPHVWQSYQRWSDGSYRRLPSQYGTLERANDRSGV